MISRSYHEAERAVVHVDRRGDETADDDASTGHEVEDHGLHD